MHSDTFKLWQWCNSSAEKHKVRLLITVSYLLGQHCQDYIWLDVDDPHLFGMDTLRFILLRLCPVGGDGAPPTMSACVLRKNVVIDKMWIISISWIACFSDAKRLCYNTMTLVCQRGGWWRESVLGGRGHPGSLWPYIADNLNRSPVGLEEGEPMIHWAILMTATVASSQMRCSWHDALSIHRPRHLLLCNGRSFPAELERVCSSSASSGKRTAAGPS